MRILRHGCGLVWPEIVGDEEWGEKGEVLRIELDPAEFARKKKIELTVKCGNNAVKFAKGVNGPLLEVGFGE